MCFNSVHGPKRRGDEDHDQLLVKNEGRGQGSGTGIIEVAQEVGTKVTMAVHVIGSVQENNYYEAAKIGIALEWGHSELSIAETQEKIVTFYHNSFTLNTIYQASYAPLFYESLPFVCSMVRILLGGDLLTSRQQCVFAQVQLYGNSWYLKDWIYVYSIQVL